MDPMVTVAVGEWLTGEGAAAWSPGGAVGLILVFYTPKYFYMVK